jgi:hypothetical protein
MAAAAVRAATATVGSHSTMNTLLPPRVMLAFSSP